MPTIHPNLIERKISPFLSVYTLQIPSVPGGFVYPFSCFHVMHLFAFRVYPCLSSVGGPHMWFVMYYYHFRGCLASVQYKYRGIALFLRLMK